MEKAGCADERAKDQIVAAELFLDSRSRSRNVDASTRAHNWSTTLDVRRPINN